MRAKRPWTELDLQRLRELAPTHTAREVAAALGRTLSAIRFAAWRDGVRFGRMAGRWGQYRRWSIRDLYEIMPQLGTKTMRDIAEPRGWSPGSLWVQLRCAGISRWAGTVSWKQAKQMTGVSGMQLNTARRAVGIHRTGSGGRLQLTYKELARMCSWLLDDAPAVTQCRIRVPASRLRRVRDEMLGLAADPLELEAADA